MVGTSTLGGSSIDVVTEGYELFADEDAAYGAFFDDFAWTIGKSEAQFYDQYEGFFIVLLSRFAARPSAWAAHEMSTHYFKLVNWAEGLLHETKPDAIFSYFLPHDPSSFALYLASKRTKIPYIFLDAPRLANVGRLLACSYSKRMLLAHDSGFPENVELHRVLDDYVERLSKDYLSNRTKSFLEASGISKVGARPSLLARALVWRLSILQKVRRDRTRRALPRIGQFLAGRILPAPPSMLKFRRGSWQHSHTRLRRTDWLRVRTRVKIRLRRQKRAYERLAKAGQVSGRYLLLALPLQPEGSTLPAALRDHDLELLVRRLLRAMPSDLQLLVKVHPIQFVRGVIYTSAIDWFEPHYYRELVAIGAGRIVLTSLDDDPQVLLDGSIGVAVINGSLGFEALARGKRVIHTASIWYEGADGTHFCSETKDFEKAIQAMLDCKTFSPPSLRFAESSSLVARDTGGELTETDMPELSEKFLASLKRFESLPLSKWSP